MLCDTIENLRHHYFNELSGNNIFIAHSSHVYFSFVSSTKPTKNYIFPRTFQYHKRIFKCTCFSSENLSIVLDSMWNQIHRISYPYLIDIFRHHNSMHQYRPFLFFSQCHYPIYLPTVTFNLFMIRHIHTSSNHTNTTSCCISVLWANLNELIKILFAITSSLT